MVADEVSGKILTSYFFVGYLMALSDEWRIREDRKEPVAVQTWD
jgi:hypothetical protein